MTKKNAVPEEDKSLRDSLDEAFGDDEEQQAAVTEGDDGLPESKVDSQDSDESQAGEEGGEESESQEAGKSDDDKSDKLDTDSDGKPADDSSGEKLSDEIGKKPPINWPPKAREQWLKLPKEVREQITLRERDMAQAMEGTASAKQVASELESLAKSYAPIMAAEGVNDPMTAVKGLFKTVAELRVGSPAQKAQRMAQMINHYGIDIEALDSALAGQPIQTPEDQALAQMIDQRMAPVNQLLQELQQRQHNAAQLSQQEAQKAVETFQGEFFADVRMDMADLIDMAAKRGQNMTLQEAYDKAVLLKPDIQEVLAERKRNESLLGEQNKLNQKREAGGASLVGKKSGGGAMDGNLDLRGQLEAAWGESERI